MQVPYGAWLGGFLDLTWPPMLTSKNTTGLTGLEFATAMAPTRKQKQESEVPANLTPTARVWFPAQARKSLPRLGPPPEAPPHPRPALSAEASHVSARKLGDAAVGGLDLLHWWL